MSSDPTTAPTSLTFASTCNISYDHDGNDDDPVAYGLEQDLTLRRQLPLDRHLLFLYDTLHGTKTPVKDDHGKRARKAIDAVLAECPDLAHDRQACLDVPPQVAFDGLDRDHWSFFERAFTTRALRFDGFDLGFSSTNRRLEGREVDAEVERLRGADLRTIWLPIRSEAWNTALESGDGRGEVLVEESLELDVGEGEIGRLLAFGGDLSALAKQLAPTYSKKRDMCLSPVLLPMSEIGSDEDHGDGDAIQGVHIQLDPLSDPTSLKSDDIRAVEEAIGVRQETIIFPSSPPFECDEILQPVSLERILRRVAPASNVRFETPMLPSSSACDDHMAWVDFVKQLPPMEVIEHNTSSDLPSDHIFDDGMRGMVAAAAAHTIKGVEQEQFHPAEATARFDVPVVVDCTIEKPKWMDVGDNARAQFAFVSVTNMDSMSLSLLPRDANERKLGWMPITAKPVALLAPDRPGLPPDAHALLPLWDDERDNPFIPQWQLPKGTPSEDEGDGLEMIMSDDSPPGSDEPSPRPVSLMGGLLELARKRKMEQENDDAERANKVPRQDNTLSGIPQAPLLASATDSAADRIASFMVRAGMDPTLFKNLGASLTKEPANKAPTLDKQTIPNHGAPGDNPPVKKTIEPRATVPGPPLKLPEMQCTFVSSLEAVPLTCEILKIWPDARFIDRDYNGHNGLVWAKGSADRQTVKSPLSYEADISVSPLTGIITTSVISVMQRAPVGSKQLTPIRERVNRVAPMYGKLIVLVSEGNDDHSLISARELSAYAEFSAWAASLPWSVPVSFVAGGKEALARWTVAVMCRYVHEGAASHFLIPTETSWEVFLRRVGINTYAAQLVVGATRGMFGDRAALAMFLEQTPARRARVLSHLFGRTDVVERAWPALDQRWAGAVAEVGG